ncbi:MAG: MFS transporter [Acidimicrobiales bacterium]
MASQFLVVLDASIVSVALPAIGRDLAMTQAHLQYVVSLYALTFGGLLVVGARVGDRFGRARTMRVGLVLFAAASVLCGLASNEAVILIGRSIQGAAAALISPTALALLTESFPEDEARQRALGVWGAASAAGGAAGLLLGGLLTDGPGWPWIFYVNVPVAGGLALATRLVLPRVDARSTGRFDVAGAVLLTGGLAALIQGLTAGPTSGWADPTTVALLAGSGGGLGLFVVVQRHTVSPLVPPRVLRTGSVLAANVAGLAVAALIAGQSFFTSLYLQGSLGYSALRTGLAVLPLTLTALIASNLAGRLMGRLGPRVVLVASFLSMGAGFVLLARLGLDSGYVRDIVAPFLLFGAGVGGAFVAVTVAANDGVAPDDTGTASGLINTSNQLGFSLGIAALVAVATTAGRTTGDAARAAVDGYQAAWTVAAVVAVVSAVTAHLALRSSNRSTSTAHHINERQPTQ